MLSQSDISDASSKPRSTPVRRCLLATIDTAQAPLSAGDFLQALDQAGLTVNKTTVYRQLDSLVDQGLLARLDLGDGKKRYEPARGDMGHPHVLCMRCGAVSCLPDTGEVAALQRQVAQESGFDVQGCSIRLYGVCSLCKKEED